MTQFSKFPFSATLEGRTQGFNAFLSTVYYELKHALRWSASKAKWKKINREMLSISRSSVSLCCRRFCVFKLYMAIQSIFKLTCVLSRSNRFRAFIAERLRQHFQLRQESPREAAIAAWKTVEKDVETKLHNNFFLSLALWILSAATKLNLLAGAVRMWCFLPDSFRKQEGYKRKLGKPPTAPCSRCHNKANGMSQRDESNNKLWCLTSHAAASKNINSI